MIVSENAFSSTCCDSKLNTAEGACLFFCILASFQVRVHTLAHCDRCSLLLQLAPLPGQELCSAGQQSILPSVQNHMYLDKLPISPESQPLWDATTCKQSFSHSDITRPPVSLQHPDALQLAFRIKQVFVFLSSRLQ